MIKHIFKLLWNERRANAWLLAEYILVFTVLWFCTDLIYTITKASMTSIGYDITDTYKLNMQQKSESVLAAANDGETPEFNRSEVFHTFLDRVERHPDVEAVSFSLSALPYSTASSSIGVTVNSDSMLHNLLVYFASNGFFDVFRIPMMQGRTYDWNDSGDRDNVVIIPRNRKGEFYSNYMTDELTPYDARQIESMVRTWDDRTVNVVGVTGPLRRNEYHPPQIGLFWSFSNTYRSLKELEIAVRVRPGAADGFAERFHKEMYQQLQIGPNFLTSVEPMEDIRERALRGDRSTMKAVYALTLFLVVNIFMGILGTFWFRTQTRRSEIGLRMALGSTRKSIKKLFAGETIILLLVASVIGTVICLNLNAEGLISEIVDINFRRTAWGVGREQDLINYVLTFTFLAAVSLFAVWYPAGQAAKTQPAEVLHEE